MGGDEDAHRHGEQGGSSDERDESPMSAHRMPGGPTHILAGQHSGQLHHWTGLAGQVRGCGGRILGAVLPVS